MSLLVCGSSFDVDLPLSCDDEYLEHPDPEKAFKQPAGVPSQMDYFISMIRLIQILDFALRTLVRSPNPDLVVRVPKLIPTRCCSIRRGSRERSWVMWANGGKATSFLLWRPR